VLPVVSSALCIGIDTLTCLHAHPPFLGRPDVFHRRRLFVLLALQGPCPPSLRPTALFRMNAAVPVHDPALWFDDVRVGVEFWVVWAHAFPLA